MHNLPSTFIMVLVYPSLHWAKSLPMLSNVSHFQRLTSQVLFDDNTNSKKSPHLSSENQHMKAWFSLKQILDIFFLTYVLPISFTNHIFILMFWVFSWVTLDFCHDWKISWLDLWLVVVLFYFILSLHKLLFMKTQIG